MKTQLTGIAMAVALMFLAAGSPALAGEKLAPSRMAIWSAEPVVILPDQPKPRKYFDHLWGFHPPFQIDCNFGYAAGVCEMLVQSHMGEIQLLPALPKAWPGGHVKGLRVRGGYELDLEWKDGKLTKAPLLGVSNESSQCTVRYGDTTKTFEIARGHTKTLAANEFTARTTPAEPRSATK